MDGTNNTPQQGSSRPRCPYAPGNNFNSPAHQPFQIGRWASYQSSRPQPVFHHRSFDPTPTPWPTDNYASAPSMSHPFAASPASTSWNHSATFMPANGWHDFPEPQLNAQHLDGPNNRSFPSLPPMSVPYDYHWSSPWRREYEELGIFNLEPRPNSLENGGPSRQPNAGSSSANMTYRPGSSFYYTF